MTSPVAQPRADFRAKEKADTINKPRGNKPEGKRRLRQFPVGNKAPEVPLQRKPGWLTWGDSSRPRPTEPRLEGLPVSRRLIVNLASGTGGTMLPISLRLPPQRLDIIL